MFWLMVKVWGTIWGIYIPKQVKKGLNVELILVTPHEQIIDAGSDAAAFVFQLPCGNTRSAVICIFVSLSQIKKKKKGGSPSENKHE